MKFSIFSIPDDVKTLAIIDAGVLHQSPKAHLMTDAAKIVTWKFFLEKRDPTINSINRRIFRAIQEMDGYSMLWRKIRCWIFWRKSSRKTQGIWQIRGAKKNKE